MNKYQERDRLLEEDRKLLEEYVALGEQRTAAAKAAGGWRPGLVPDIQARQVEIEKERRGLWARIEKLTEEILAEEILEEERNWTKRNKR